MGLISKTVKMKWGTRNKKKYMDKGYKFTKMNDEFELKIEDLSNGSNIGVEVVCDGKNCTTPLLNPTKWINYLRSVHEDGTYYCNKCAKKIFGDKKRIETMLKGGENSLGYWFIKHLTLKKAVKLIARWDEDKNGIDIRKVCTSSSGFNDKGYWFKCFEHPEHGSELNNTNNYIKNFKKRIKMDTLECDKCNSIGQYIIDKYGENALDLYWNYNKNIDENGKSINPLSLSKCCDNIIYIYCQNDNKHESYPVRCADFTRKNCRCPICRTSKGEIRIYSYLQKNNIFNIPQKPFDGLLGIKGGNLSYDFYFPQYNLLIEYQGEYHDGTVHNQTKEDFEKQQEHDRRKAQYAKDNHINLLPIWYWDYDNIETILDELINNMEVI